MSKRNKEHKVFSKDQTAASIKTISGVIKDFDTFDGEKGSRNTIKKIIIENFSFNVKSFKVPHLINRIAYSFFRKSKANRSFEYAEILINNGINTPKPIAYFEFFNFNFLNKSFYISNQLDYDITYRELVNNEDYPNFDTILRDHSPGNTLIKRNESTKKYDFYLVDLNRMKFHQMSFKDRMKNFSKLTPRKEMVEVMANEYAKLFGESEKKIFNQMWLFTEEFQKKYHKKIATKKKIFFWK
jgi:hypothetical protein